jgi:ribosomal protein L34E
MEKMKKLTPPTCPNCQEPLKKVREEMDDEIYEFNPQTGTYRQVEPSSSLVAVCGECGEELGELFQEGVCNYHAN